jgi:hypothetical protein
MKICEICGAEFEPTSNRQKYCCDDCLKIAKKQWNKKQKHKKQCIKSKKRLDEKLAEINFYNEQHGTHYTYGEYQALKRLDKL